MNLKISSASLFVILAASLSISGVGRCADNVTAQATPDHYSSIPSFEVLGKQLEADHKLAAQGKFDHTGILTSGAYAHNGKVTSDKDGSPSPSSAGCLSTSSPNPPGAPDGTSFKDRKYAACSIGAPGVAGQCHYYQLYANWIFNNDLPASVNPPVGQIIEDFGYENTPGIYITYSSPSQVNVAVAAGAKFAFDGYMYISAPSNTGGTQWVGHGFDAFVLPY